MLKPFRSSESKLMVTTVLETSDSAPASAWLLSCGPLHLGPTCCCCQLSKSVYCCSLFSSQFSKTCWEENYPCSNTHMLVIMYWRPLLICYLLGVCFASIAEEGFLISSRYSLELCIQMLMSFPFSFAFHFSSFHSYLKGLPRQPFCFFAFLFWGWSWSLSPVQCHEPRSIVNQALYLSDLGP